jgi:hypothetical protein
MYFILIFVSPVIEQMTVLSEKNKGRGPDLQEMPAHVTQEIMFSSHN